MNDPMNGLFISYAEWLACDFNGRFIVAMFDEFHRLRMPNIASDDFIPAYCGL